MRNKWNQKIANSYISSFQKKSIKKDLSLRIYTTHLLGKEPDLVLHGGGNTSLKSFNRNILGKEVEIIYVKGSGWNMADLSEEGMPGLELEPLKKTLRLKKLNDEKMVNYLRKNLINNKSPNPSVETLLHAYLPHKYVDHTHSVAILSIANQVNSIEICKKIFKNKIGVVPYIMPGFELAVKAYMEFNKDKDIEGLILLHHGIFTFGNTAKESYERMIKYVTIAEKFINQQKRKNIRHRKFNYSYDSNDISLKIRKSVYDLSERKWILNFCNLKKITEFTSSKELLNLINKGPVTPDHVIRIKPNLLILKNNNLIDRNIKKFAFQYSKYFSKYKKFVKGAIISDLIPRIIILPGSGAFSLGRSFKESQISLDIFLSVIKSIGWAKRIGNFKSIPKKEIFKMEYWPLERAKISNKKESNLSGNVVVITGGCGTIGIATAEEFINEGAEVVLLDNDKNNIASIPKNIKSKSIIINCDLTNNLMVKKALKKIINTYGGIDIIVSNAGRAFEGEMMNVKAETIKKSYEINFYSHQYISQEAVKIFKKQRLGGLILFNISKQSINPGKNFGPYGLPKSSTLFLMKQYVLEYSKYGIRFNGVNADRIQSGILNKQLIKKRAKARGLSTKNYMKGNLLQTEIMAKDVAKAFLFQAKLTKTTGNVITVDGGNIEASLR